jgi:hypothetical protein
LNLFYSLYILSQQAKNCVQTAIAPFPTKKRKVQLPSHFQFFSNDASKVEEQASSAWRKGFSRPFKSYQKVQEFLFFVYLMDTNKNFVLVYAK